MEHSNIIISSYSEGTAVEDIAGILGLTVDNILEALRTYKDQSRAGKTFTDEFKQMIAERDAYGVSRTLMASELSINFTTVKRACEAFGQAYKDRVDINHLYTRVGSLEEMKSPDFFKQCKTCDSKLNEIPENSYYCRSCGSEYERQKDGFYKVNWEYVD